MAERTAISVASRSRWPVLAAIIKDHTQQLIYFVRDFLADRFGCFFSCADTAGSCRGRNGRSSLTAKSSIAAIAETVVFGDLSLSFRQCGR